MNSYLLRSQNVRQTWFGGCCLCAYEKTCWGFPHGSDGKESACNAGDPGSIPGLERSPGEGNGNPLQCSCLENPRDGEAWWAAIYGVAQSRTRLKRLSSSSSILWASLLAQTLKNPPAMQDIQVQSFGWEDRLEKGMATHSIILVWTIPCTEEPGGLQSMGL